MKKIKKNNNEGPWKGKSSLYTLWFLGPPKEFSGQATSNCKCFIYDCKLYTINAKVMSLQKGLNHYLVDKLPDSSCWSNLYLQKVMNQMIWIDSEGTCSLTL